MFVILFCGYAKHRIADAQILRIARNYSSKRWIKMGTSCWRCTHL